MTETGLRKGFARRRSRARRHAMQALYQWQLTGHDLGTVEAQFLAEEDLSKADLGYFRELLHRIPAQLDAINAALAPLLDRPLEQVDPVEKAILWIGGYELSSRPDVPYRVVINEAVELAKKYGAEQGHRFVNGVLDKAARRLRAEEIGTGP